MYREVFVPVDNSQHSDWAVERAIELCGQTGGRITGNHVYAARLHDVRFRQLETGLPGFFYGVLEGNLIYQGKNESNVVKDQNSGGTTFFLSPGVQYITRRWIVEAVVQLPVAQDLNGSALEDDFVVRAGFRINF